MNGSHRITVIAGLLIAFSGCGGGSDQASKTETANAAQPAASTASEAEWVVLSDNPDAWIMANPGAWAFENSSMSKDDGGGDIWTTERYGDFVLECDFKINEGGNSGIFFRTDDVKDPVQTGIEIQVYNTPRQPEPVKNDCGAVYDLMAPSVYADKPAGEWNHIVLTCAGPNISVVLNGTTIVSDMNLDNWTEAGKNPDGTTNKFAKALKDFKREVHIGFQEHGDPVWYRNVKIKKL